MFPWSDGDPKATVRKWKSEMRKEQRTLDRQIRNIQREETKVRQSIKAAAKRGDTGTCKTLAREVVHSRRAVSRMHTSKAQMNSVMMQMENQMAQQKLTGHMAKSTDVMKMMNRLTKVSEISSAMQEMQQEMMKAGVIEEMVDDAMDVLEDDGDEDAADEEVNRVLTELAAENFKSAESAPTRQPVASNVDANAAAAEQEEDDEDMAAMREKLAQIKG